MKLYKRDGIWYKSFITALLYISNPKMQGRFSLSNCDYIKHLYFGISLYKTKTSEKEIRK